jgi:hypothetical protein
MISFMISVAPPYLDWTRLSRQSTIVSESSGLVLLAGQGPAPSCSGDNFQELAVTKPGLVGNEIIGALGMRMAILMDKSPTRVEPTANRMLREAEQAGRDVTAVRLGKMLPASLAGTPHASPHAAANRSGKLGSSMSTVSN